MQKEFKQNSFLGGAINDPRSDLYNGFWYSENFEVGKRKSLKQVVNNQAENALAHTQGNCIIKFLQVGSSLYGLGKNGTEGTKSQIWKKTAALTGDWAAATNGNTNRTFIKGDPLFLYQYPYIYFSAGESYIGRHNLTNDTMDDDWLIGDAAITAAGILNGGLLFNSKLYGWLNGAIYEFESSTTGTLSPKVTITTTQYIKEIIPYYGKLLVICSSALESVPSKAYLYDIANNRTTADEIYEIASGPVFGAAILDGKIIVACASSNKRYFQIKSFNGLFFQTEVTYSGRPNATATPYSYATPCSKLKAYGSYVYFLMALTRPNDDYAGLYQYALARYGKEEAGNSNILSIYKDFTFTTNRGVNGSTAYNDFIVLEGIDGADSATDKYLAAMIYADTNKTSFFISSAATYTAQAGVVETLKHSNGDPSIEKALKAVSVFYTAIGTGGSVVLKYRKDSDTAWTTIFTDSTAGSTERSAVNIEATSVNLPIYKEVQFRIEVINAELLGYKFKYEPQGQSNY